MIPTPRGLWALAGWLLLGVLAALWPAAGPVWGGVGLALSVLLLLDGISLRRTPTPGVERRVPASLAVGRWSPAALRLSNRASRPVRVEAYDLHPDTFDVDSFPATCRLAAESWADLPLRVRPRSRGRFAFSAVELRLAGRLGLLAEQRTVAVDTEVKVYPDFREIARYALLAGEDRTAQMGIHLQRRRGEGQEFHQLREYRQGDPSRSIDWKATARRRQIISREYREERDQQVVILLDCGRRMRAHDGTLSHFDQALNAALLLSYVALQQGDAVGIQAFSGQQRWLPPVKGRGGINRLLNGVFDLQPTTAPADFLSAATALAARQRRRALVVLITNIRDDDSVELAKAVQVLRRRHLLVVASLREAALRDATLAPISLLPDALRAAAAVRYLEQRTAAHNTLRASRVATLDVEPPELPAALVNQYLQIKRSGAL